MTDLLWGPHLFIVSVGVQDAAALDSDEEDEFIYNPLKLPMGWDGKPIPYWLYKLHGLNQAWPALMSPNEQHQWQHCGISRVCFQGASLFQPALPASKLVSGLLMAYTCAGVQV